MRNRMFRWRADLRSTDRAVASAELSGQLHHAQTFLPGTDQFVYFRETHRPRRSARHGNIESSPSAALRPAFPEVEEAFNRLRPV